MTGDKKINFGWVIVAYGVLCMLVLHYGTIGSQAIFLLPITKDLGVSTTTLTLASTYSTIVSFVVTPIAGKLMNDKSLKKLLFMGVLGTGATMVAQSYVTSVYAYYAVILVRTVFNPFALMMPFATLAARWFPKESRSFATSIIFVGIRWSFIIESADSGHRDVWLESDVPLLRICGDASCISTGSYLCPGLSGWI